MKGEYACRSPRLYSLGPFLTKRLCAGASDGVWTGVAAPTYSVRVLPAKLETHRSPLASMAKAKGKLRPAARPNPLAGESGVPGEALSDPANTVSELPW